jgi:hypothetical protein
MPIKVIVAILILALAVGAGYWFMRSSTGHQPSAETSATTKVQEASPAPQGIVRGTVSIDSLEGNAIVFRPYAAHLVVKVDDLTHTVVGEFTAESSGKFSLEVPPGGPYIITSLGGYNTVPYCGSEVFTVVTNQPTEISVRCESGVDSRM